MKRLTRQQREEQLIEELIDNMLEPYGVTKRWLMDNTEKEYGKDGKVISMKINGVEWYHYYTWTETQETEWINWAVSRVRKELRFTKSYATRYVAMLNLNYGLKTIKNEQPV